MKTFLNKVISIWQSLPRVIQYGIVSGALAVVKQNWPEVLPPNWTPELILGGGLLGAGLHHIEDRADLKKPI